MSAPEDIIVRHDSAAHRYESMHDGHLSVAEYVLQDKRMIFTHTFVPPQLRGQGVAEKLVRAALADARANGLTVVPACSYVARFIERHDEYADLLDK